MPNNRVIETLYIGPHSNIEAMNEASLYKGGELGARAASNGGKEYQLVQLDSGATSANAVGVVAVGQVAYWKNKASYIVTNDNKQAVGAAAGSRNEIAGAFTVAATAGQYCVVQQKGRIASLAIASGSPNIGDWIVGDNTASTAQGAVVAIATAPTVQPIGKAAAAGTTVTTIAVDLDVPGIP